MGDPAATDEQRADIDSLFMRLLSEDKITRELVVDIAKKLLGEDLAKALLAIYLGLVSDFEAQDMGDPPATDEQRADIDKQFKRLLQEDKVTRELVVDTAKKILGEDAEARKDAANGSYMMALTKSEAGDLLKWLWNQDDDLPF